MQRIISSFELDNVIFRIGQRWRIRLPSPKRQPLILGRPILAAAHSLLLLQAIGINALEFDAVTGRLTLLVLGRTVSGAIIFGETNLSRGRFVRNLVAGFIFRWRHDGGRLERTVAVLLLEEYDVEEKRKRGRWIEEGKDDNANSNEKDLFIPLPSSKPAKQCVDRLLRLICSAIHSFTHGLARLSRQIRPTWQPSATGICRHAYQI